MTNDLATILAEKAAARARRAALPIADKLRLLDALRERSLIIRQAADASGRADARRTPPMDSSDSVSDGQV